MIFGKTQLELKVGFFVFVGVIILAAFVLMIGKFNTLSSGYELNILFGFVNGVKDGAPVRFAGVDVGEVKRIEFVIAEENRQKVRLVAWVRNDVRIPSDSTVWVNTLGLLGEKYVEIMPGKNFAQPLRQNDIMVGTDPISMNEVGELAKSIAENLDKAIERIQNKEGTVGKLLYDDGIYNELLRVFRNKEGTIGRFLNDDSLYRQLEEMIVDLKQHPWKLFWKKK